MKKTQFIIIISLSIIILIALYFSIQSERTPTDIDSIAVREGVQIVKLTVNGLEYKLAPDTVEAGRLVRIVVDKQLNGCLNDIVIPAFGIRKYIVGNNNEIEFLPIKPGDYSIVCSMGMGRGVITVVS